MVFLIRGSWSKRCGAGRIGRFLVGQETKAVRHCLIAAEEDVAYDR